MSGQQAETPREQRWSDERSGHWHGARSSPATIERHQSTTEAADAATRLQQEDTDAVIAAATAAKSAAVHEGNVRRWEAATHRTWNREHGSGGPG